MRELDKGPSVRRRTLLTSGGATAFGAMMLSGTTIIGPNAAWAVEVSNLKPETMATLVQMARDVYPHDRLADRYYVAAVMPYDAAAGDDAALKTMLEDGVADLDSTAAGRYDRSRYVDVSWEADRVAILRDMQSTPFFQKIRGGLITGLYNNKEVWPKFGYEGSSVEYGGYIDRGFDDIDWLDQA